MIEHLRNEVFCRLGASRIPGAGVGVFAIREIAKGQRLFEWPIDDCADIDAASLSMLPPGVQRLVLDMGATYERVTTLPEMDMNRLNAGMYVNHSETPNCDMSNDDRNEFIFASRDIAAGEELCRDYRLDDTDFLFPAGDK